MDFVKVDKNKSAHVLLYQTLSSLGSLYGPYTAIPLVVLNDFVFKGFLDDQISANAFYRNSLVVLDDNAVSDFNRQ